MTRRLLLAFVLAFAVSGCGTLFDTLGDKKKRDDPRGISPTPDGGKLRIYGGLRWDLEVLAEAKAGWLLLLFVVDIPVSAAVDTLLLPLTIPYNLAK
jgi:uncharacterized protein YceK